jgi:hypothetical protein
MRWISPLARVTLGAALAVTGCLLPTGARAATGAGHPPWASAKAATIHPGVMVSMGGVDCRAGFVFTDGTRAYLSVPSSCSGTGPVDNSKCDAGQDPYGLPVTIEGAKHKGTLVYSSITTMELRGQRSANRCAFNDLSLVRIDRRDLKRTNPSLPVIGGPTGVSKDQPAALDQLCVYSSVPSNAQALSTSGGGWSHAIMVDGAVASGDLGAPVLTAKGRALGMVSGLPTANGRTLVNDLHHEIRYLHTVKKFVDVHLAKGTAKFSPMLPFLSAL